MQCRSNSCAVVCSASRFNVRRPCSSKRPRSVLPSSVQWHAATQTMHIGTAPRARTSEYCAGSGSSAGGGKVQEPARAAASDGRGAAEAGQPPQGYCRRRLARSSESTPCNASTGWGQQVSTSVCVILQVCRYLLLERLPSNNESRVFPAYSLLRSNAAHQDTATCLRPLKC